MSDEKEAAPAKPERLSWSAEGAAARWGDKHPDADAEGAAARWGDKHPDADPPHAPPSDVPEDAGIVPNRHSASAEAAALRWSEQHGDDED